ncbi:MAG TPA: hypothetical protein VFD36_31290 [Kofleriaceae bacterium]|nr:hypothetical protein [Kofleriaceae bacterium]
MWRIATCAVPALVLLGACGPDCGDIEVVVESSDTQPGSLVTGVWAGHSVLTIAPRSDGNIVCMTCSTLVTLDPRLREIDRMDASFYWSMTVGPDDALYAYQQGSRNGHPLPSFDLLAFEADGAPRWRIPISGASPTRVVAGVEGPYLEQVEGFEEGFRATITAFDAATGEPKWTRAQGLLDAAHGGVVTAERAPNTVTVRHLDPAGAVVWEHRMTSPSELFYVTDVAVTPDGGGIFVGRSRASVDFGDREIEGPPERDLYFVVEIDPVGATRWAFKTEGMFPDHVALADNGDILLTGHLAFRTDDNREDGFLAVATPAGVIRSHRIGGIASQSVNDVAAARDGVAWLQVSSSGPEGEPDPVLRIADHEFRKSGSYLFAIVP